MLILIHCSSSSSPTVLWLDSLDVSFHSLKPRCETRRRKNACSMAEVARAEDEEHEMCLWTLIPCRFIPPSRVSGLLIRTDVSDLTFQLGTVVLTLPSNVTSQQRWNPGSRESGRRTVHTDA